MTSCWEFASIVSKRGDTVRVSVRFDVASYDAEMEVRDEKGTVLNHEVVARLWPRAFNIWRQCLGSVRREGEYAAVLSTKSVLSHKRNKYPVRLVGHSSHDAITIACAGLSTDVSGRVRSLTAFVCDMASRIVQRKLSGYFERLNILRAKGTGWPVFVESRFYCARVDFDDQRYFRVFPSAVSAAAFGLIRIAAITLEVAWSALSRELQDAYDEVELREYRNRRVTASAVPATGEGAKLIIDDQEEKCASVVVIGDADSALTARPILYWDAGADVPTDSYFWDIRWVDEDAVFLGSQLGFGLKWGL